MELSRAINGNEFEKVVPLHPQLEKEQGCHPQVVGERSSFSEIIGKSSVLRAVLDQIEKVGSTDATVLLLGESGTGKEVMASAIHQCSRRRSHPLVRVNCASVPAELFESEFFGHVKGAFTGALRDRVGRFQLADGGTLFLDEVGEIPLPLQGKLLRVLQEGEFECVGEDRTRKVNVRIIAATNRDLEHEVANGGFRQDLYYRLGVFPIELPPLREHKEDIADLAAHFLQISAVELNRRAVTLTQSDVEVLNGYDWPGNIRELQHVIERAVILAEGSQIRLDLAFPQGSRHGRIAAVTKDPPRGSASRPGIMRYTDLKEHERENVIEALERVCGKVYGSGGAAQLLGIRPTTLAYRMKVLGIKRLCDVKFRFD